MYVYIESEMGLYTVGFYRPSDMSWQPESEWDDKEKAASRVHYLNGGSKDVD